MKRSQVVGRIGIESEQLSSSSCPRSARWVGLIRTERASDHAAVTESVKDRLAPIHFDATDNVSMVAEHDVSASIDRCLCDRPFVWSEPSTGMNDALVQGHDHEIRTHPRLLDIKSHILERSGFRS